MGKFFTDRWCPLFGSVPRLDNKQADSVEERCSTVIFEARKFFDTNGLPWPDIEDLTDDDWMDGLNMEFKYSAQVKYGFDLSIFRLPVPCQSCVSVDDFYNCVQSCTPFIERNKAQDHRVEQFDFPSPGDVPGYNKDRLLAARKLFLEYEWLSMMAKDHGTLDTYWEEQQIQKKLYVQVLVLDRLWVVGAAKAFVEHVEESLSDTEILAVLAIAAAFNVMRDVLEHPRVSPTTDYVLRECMVAEGLLARAKEESKLLEVLSLQTELERSTQEIVKFHKGGRKKRVHPDVFYTTFEEKLRENSGKNLSKIINETVQTVKETYKKAKTKPGELRPYFEGKDSTEHRQRLKKALRQYEYRKWKNGKMEKNKPLPSSVLQMHRCISRHRSRYDLMNFMGELKKDGGKKPMDETRITYRPVELARMTGLSRSAVYKLIQTGDIASIRLGGSYLVRKETVDDLLKRK